MTTLNRINPLSTKHDYKYYPLKVTLLNYGYVLQVITIYIVSK